MPVRRKRPPSPSSAPRRRRRPRLLVDLDAVPWERTAVPGISIRVLRRDPASRDAVVLVRMEGGAVYPRHRHRGAEEVLVLAGGYRDDRGEYRAGSFVLNPAGSVHTPVALPDGPCVLFAVAHGGVELLDRRGTPSS